MRGHLPHAFLWTLCLTSCVSAHEGASGSGQPPAASAPEQAADRGTSAASGANGPISNSGTSSTGATEAARDARAAPAAPPDWRCARVGCGLRLCAPTPMVAIPVRGVDSCVAEFATADCDYIADLPHGIGLSSPSEAHEYVRVDGKLARLDTFTATSLPERSYGAAIHFDTLWGGEPFEAQLTIVAQCATREAQATARAVLQTVELPPVGVGDRTLEPSTEDCQGYDVRPVEGYVLGRSCVAPKSRVPGVCAIGSISNFSSGTGQSVCFVTAAGEYMSAFVRYGESIVGNGSRYGHGDVLPPPQLSADEEARCQMLVNLLEPTDAGANDITGERAYVGCP